MHSIQRDMIMLENQLPLFVLNRLLGLQSDTQNQTGIVAEVAVRFFKPLMPTSKAVTERDQLKLMNWRRKLVDNGELHCLDVFHGSIFRTFQSSTRTPYQTTRRYMSFRNMSMVDKRQQQLIHCVTELREAGVKFRRKKTNELWDIGFKNGYLEIPKLLIHDGELTSLFYFNFLFLPH